MVVATYTGRIITTAVRDTILFQIPVKDTISGSSQANTHVFVTATISGLSPIKRDYVAVTVLELYWCSEYEVNFTNNFNVLESRMGSVARSV